MHPSKCYEEDLNDRPWSAQINCSIWFSRTVGQGTKEMPLSGGIIVGALKEGLNMRGLFEGLPEVIITMI